MSGGGGGGHRVHGSDGVGNGGDEHVRVCCDGGVGSVNGRADKRLCGCWWRWRWRV